MRKDRLYLLTLLAISIIVFAIGYFSMTSMVKASTNQFLENQIESSKREASEFAKLISFQIDSGIDRETLINNIQKSIEHTNTEIGFICMFDWSGVEICHPDPQKIGKQTNSDESFVRPINDPLNSDDFYDLLTKKTQKGGVRNFPNSDRSSEIIYLYPVKNTDWIIAAHANISKIEKQIKQLKVNFLWTYLLTSSGIILLSLFAVRYLGSYYEKELELKNKKLTEEVLNLSHLNSDLTKYKDKISKSLEKDSETMASEIGLSKIKKRILTYSKDKLITVNTDQIAFIYTEHSITYIICSNGKKHTSNSSLDELYKSLDKTIFFRANRQYILSVKGIDEILKYGNNQLKIKMNPESEGDIIISKNKASEFKKWLSM